MSSLIDKDGVVHDKGWGGQYKPKQGWFGPQKETNWLGQPSVARDFFGNPKAERDWLGRPVRAQSGTPLYQRSGGGTSRRSSSSNAGDEAIGCLVILAMAIVFLAALAVFLWVIFPVFVMLHHGLSTENGRRDLGRFTLTVLAVTALGYLSVFAWQTATNPYAVLWQQLLYVALAGVGWFGLGGLALAQGWFQPMWEAVSNVAVAYKCSVVTMWDWTWRKI